ncbi:MAG: class I SAM-dependent methyltransferase [Gammaproteobacteria bacterium]
MSNAANPGRSPAASEHWSAYWAAGPLTSLPSDFAANYDGEIAEFWHRQFADVPAGGSVLDVCTGNGAVALLAAAWFAGHDRAVEVTAVDAARIDPASVAAAHPEVADAVQRVRFQGQTPVESLDLPEASFDLVTSQYGIEYCDPEPAARRVAALLKPGGRLVMLCHEASSDILRTMEAEAADYRRLRELGFPAGLRRFLAGTLSFARFRKLMRNVGEALAGEYRIRSSPLYAFVLRMLEGAVRMDEATLRAHRLKLVDFSRQLELGEARLADMLRVNRVLHDDPDWHQAFQTAGLRLLDLGEILYRGKHRSGQTCRFEKPA